LQKTYFFEGFAGTTTAIEEKVGHGRKDLKRLVIPSI